ncbi:MULTISPECIES: cbb3-type cytochrome oxidase assembly protein [Acinetobacter Taxon 24D]|uniref:cbb3-type cytochrome oxidase assembly protein n=1 Tax=Acinetobacter Taxon 24D TaxID=2839057 RepID=UPI0013F3D19B|nr:MULTISPECIES: cbb3-type cytochrome oxidase assembly protein [Acinetobacter Taxon 24D]NNG80642.1 cbb3-type cytochrome oxidase assembly protein [Acinetobacter sp. ANC 5378]
MNEPKKPFPYLVVGISLLLGCMFLGFFFLAVTNEPEYMPSHQKKLAEAAKVQINR